MYDDLPQRKLEAAECLECFVTQSTISQTYLKIYSPPVDVYWDKERHSFMIKTEKHEYGLKTDN